MYHRIRSLLHLSASSPLMENVKATSLKYVVTLTHNRLSTTRTRMSYVIIQFYLSPDRGDVPTPSRSWYAIYRPRGTKGRVDLNQLV